MQRKAFLFNLTYVNCDLDLLCKRHNFLVKGNHVSQVWSRYIGLVSMMPTRLFLYLSIVSVAIDIWPWPRLAMSMVTLTIDKYKVNRQHPLMDNLRAYLISFVSVVFACLFSYLFIVISQLTSQIIRLQGHDVQDGQTHSWNQYYISALQPVAWE